MKSGLFLPALHSKVVFKKALSCNIRPRHLTQSSSHSICLRTYYNCVRFTQHRLVWNVCVLAEKNNYADSIIVRVKNIMISACHWWHFLTATCAIVLSLCFYQCISVLTLRNILVCFRAMMKVIDAIVAFIQNEETVSLILWFATNIFSN